MSAITTDAAVLPPVYNIQLNPSGVAMAMPSYSSPDAEASNLGPGYNIMDSNGMFVRFIRLSFCLPTGKADYLFSYVSYFPLEFIPAIDNADRIMA